MPGPEIDTGTGNPHPTGKNARHDKPGKHGDTGKASPADMTGKPDCKSSHPCAAKTGRKVLFIVYYLPPMGSSGVQRPLKLIKYLPQFGWDPVVLAPEPGAYHTFDLSLAEELDQTGVPVYRVAGKTPFHAAGGATRDLSWIPEAGRKTIRSLSSWYFLPDNKKGWINPAIEQGRKLISSGDIELIFSTAPPYSNHMIAAALGREFGLPVVMDFRDDWLGSHLLNLPTAMHRKKMKKLEADTLTRASLITAINSTMLASLESRLVRPVRTEVLPQGYDPADFPGSVEEKLSSDTEIRAVTGINRRRFIITYNGIFYGAQKAYTFLNAIKALIESGTVEKRELRLVFQGGLDKDVLKLIDKLDLNDITDNKGYIPHRESVKNLMESDLLWFTVGRQKNQEQVTTGKLFEYIGTGKPILGLVPEGEAADILKKYGAGFVADPDNLADVQQTLSGLLSMFRESVFPEPDLDYAGNYNRVKIAGKLAALFDELKSHNPGEV
jgi:glycosyltransferase involved in cell wall biosynthesis